MADTPAPTIVTNQSPSEPPPEDFAGRTLGDFELVRRIGMGGMGQVYLARQKSLKRQVAIKILKAELAANTTALRRFQAEAEAIANITHANIVQVYAIGDTEGLHYMALEYVDGRNFRDYLEKKGIPDVPFALNMMQQVASALDRAGELGFVHRDIKPENILLSKKGEVKVTDFGLSRAFGTEAPLNLTQSGVTMGTPLYMSPEQVRGQPVDPRSDLYSFGVTCYHLLAGEPPFRGSTAFDVALQHVQAEPRLLASIRPDLPTDLCSIVHKLMAKNPDDRYQSARELQTDLQRFREGAGLSFASLPVPLSSSQLTATLPPATTPTSNPWRWVIVGLLALLAAGGGAALHWAQSPLPPAPDPDAALADVDPSPDLLHEKELKKLIADKSVKVEFAADALLELTLYYIKERRFDEALKLFEGDLAKKYAAFDVPTKDLPRVRNMTNILAGLGRGVVFAHQDKAEPSNEEFAKILRDNPAMLRPGKIDLPKLPPPPRGQLETFFALPQAGMNWKKAVGDALDRNAKNLPGKSIPSDFARLRAIPMKGPLPRS